MSFSLRYFFKFTDRKRSLMYAIVSFVTFELTKVFSRCRLTSGKVLKKTISTLSVLAGKGLYSATFLLIKGVIFFGVSTKLKAMMPLTAIRTIRDARTIPIIFRTFFISSVNSGKCVAYIEVITINQGSGCKLIDSIYFGDYCTELCLMKLCQDIVFQCPSKRY